MPGLVLYNVPFSGVRVKTVLEMQTHTIMFPLSKRASVNTHRQHVNTHEVRAQGELLAFMLS